MLHIPNGPLAHPQFPNSPLYKPWGASYVPAPMILASIDWLSISINVLLVVFVIVCLLMTLLILMQRPKQEGLGAAFGGGVTDQVFGARTTNVLQKGTVWLGSLFFLLSLTLAVLVGLQNKQKQIVDPKKPAAEETAEAPTSNTEADGPKSLAEELSIEETTDTPAEDTPAEETDTSAPEADATEEAPTEPTNENPEEKSDDAER